MAHIPFALPAMDGAEEAAVVKVLRSGWLTTGDEAARLEKEFAAFVKSPFALAVSSATAGLHMGLEVCGVGPESFVITTPFTFVASAEVIRYLGGHPLFADIDPDTLNIDPVKVEEILAGRGKRPAGGAGSKATGDKSAHKKDISAILPVHLCGKMCDMKSIMSLSKAYRVPVVEDVAHAFPAWREGKHAGTMGKVGVFSFYATKPLATGEGGMVVTTGAELAKKMSRLRLHGIDRHVWDRYHARGPAAWEYDITVKGYKYNMPDTAAALGRVQLGKTAAHRDRRGTIASAYLNGFNDCDFLILPSGRPEDSDHSWHLFIVRINPRNLSIDRDEYIRRLMEAGIGVSVHYKPLHLMSYYKKLYGFKPSDFPESLKVFKTCFSLPLYPGLSDEQVGFIVRKVKEIGGAFHRAAVYGGTGKGKKG